MTQPLGIRFSEEFLDKIGKLSKEEMTDKSVIIRKLVLIGYLEFMKQRSADSYVREEITFSEAAHRAGLTLFEMEKYLVEKGFKSDYSIEDLEEEMNLLS